MVLFSIPDLNKGLSMFGIGGFWYTGVMRPFIAIVTLWQSKSMLISQATFSLKWFNIELVEEQSDKITHYNKPVFAQIISSKPISLHRHPVFGSPLH